VRSWLLLQWRAWALPPGLRERGQPDLCRLDRDLKAFRDRPLDHLGLPYVFFDAAYVKGRVRRRVGLGR